MNTLVESLKRLYSEGKVTVGKLNSMLSDGKITQQEHTYITS
jgi:hypothetical protein